MRVLLLYMDAALHIHIQQRGFMQLPDPLHFAFQGTVIFSFVHHFPFYKFLLFYFIFKICYRYKLIIHFVFFIITGLPGGTGNRKSQLLRQGVEQVPCHRCFASTGGGGNDDEFVVRFRHANEGGQK